MRALDEIYTATPFYGSRRMQVALQRRGLSVNRKRVQRLMRTMGLEAVGPKPRLSRPHPDLKQRFEREAKTISSLNHGWVILAQDDDEEDDLDDAEDDGGEDETEEEEDDDDYRPKWSPGWSD